MTFAFSTPVKAVGAFMNYFINLDGTLPDGDVTISALGQSGNLLESWNISTDYPILTGGASVNQGAFRGIARPQADIYSFTVSNSFSLLTDLRFDAVPIPPTVWLLGSGLLALVGLRRRSKK
jgi:hypothetical protein